MIHAVIHWGRRLGQLNGWRRCLAAFLCGMAGTLALAPLFLFPLLLPAFTGLFSLLQGATSRRQMFWDGWWWGWGYYMSGLYWFCVALMTDADKFAWLIPFALFGLTGVIAIYAGLACWFMGWVYVAGLRRILLFAVLWTVMEYIRGHILSGFPWNLTGYALGFSLWSLQLAALLGAYGLTLLAVLLGLSPAMLAAGRRGLHSAAGLWVLLAVGMGWGAWRVSAYETQYVPEVMLRLVQANIAQPHKWDPNRQLEGMKEHARLMLSAGAENITHFVWPETAVPYVLEGDSPLAKLLGEALPPKAVLITGALRSKGTEQEWDIWNSLMAVDARGKLLGSYDKQRLVPFGEFQPLRPYVPKDWMTPVGEKDFSWGQGDPVQSWTGLPPFRALICYEAIFPELAAAPGAHWLLNVTNDAWFGISSGPYQHFHMARMRAVEQGLPLVRAANTGISAIIDPMGRILGQLPLGTQGVLDLRLPKSLEHPTLYAAIAGVELPLLVLWGAWLAWRKRPKTAQHV